MRTLVVAVALGVSACAATPHPPNRSARAGCAAPTWRSLAGTVERAPAAQITFVVTPHPKVDRVVVGNAPALAPLRSLVGGAFEPVRIGRLADEIKETYIDEGYLDARVAVYHATAQPGIALCVDSDRGTRFHIGEITFAGRNKISEAALLADLGIHPGSVANRQLIERATLVVSYVYWNHGMAKVKLAEPVLTRNRDRLDVEFRILDEGALYHYGEIQLENGDGLTLPPTIAPGQLYSSKQLADVREALDLQLRGPTEVITSAMPYVVALTKRDETTHTIGVTFAVKRP